MLKTILGIIFCWVAVMCNISLNATSKQIASENAKEGNTQGHKVTPKPPFFLTEDNKKDIINVLNNAKKPIKDIQIVFKDQLSSLPLEDLTSTDPNTVFIKNPFPFRTLEKNAPINAVQERLRKKFKEKEINKFETSNKKDVTTDSNTAKKAIPSEEKKDKPSQSQSKPKKTKKKKTK